MISSDEPTAYTPSEQVLFYFQISLTQYLPYVMYVDGIRVELRMMSECWSRRPENCQSAPAQTNTFRWKTVKIKMRPKKTRMRLWRGGKPVNHINRLLLEATSIDTAISYFRPWVDECAAQTREGEGQPSERDWKVKACFAIRIEPCYDKIFFCEPPSIHKHLVYVPRHITPLPFRIYAFIALTVYSQSRIDDDS